MRVKHPIPYVWEDGIDGSEEARGIWRGEIERLELPVYSYGWL